MADHRHKREPDARRLFGAVANTKTVAGGLAALATTAVVTAGVLDSSIGSGLVAADAAGAADRARATMTAQADVSDRFVVSRSTSRTKSKKDAVKEARADGALAATAKAVRQADTRLWTTAPLNLWTKSGKDARLVGEIPSGRRVLVTGRQAGEREEIVVGGKSRWVTAGYLDDEKPVAFGGACTNGTSVSSGVSASIVKVHQAVCAAFPSITVYGTLRGGGGDHPLGKAVDIMVSGSVGWQVAELVRAHYAELGVSYVIYSQHIWSVERSGEGWRAMASRGSTTANHYDHVHVSVF